jgi:hypothetical protein
LIDGPGLPGLGFTVSARTFPAGHSAGRVGKPGPGEEKGANMGLQALFFYLFAFVAVEIGRASCRERVS